jgi:hypothetical protein
LQSKGPASAACAGILTSGKTLGRRTTRGMLNLLLVGIVRYIRGIVDAFACCDEYDDD